MLPNEPVNEAILVERAKTDSEAFGQLYQRYVDRIYNYIYYRVGNANDAEDLTARTFFQALKKIDSYEERGVPFSAWLYRIAHNLVANWHRQQSRRKSVPLDELAVIRSTKPSPIQEIEKKESRDQLLAAIHRLADDRQQLLILKFVERLPNAEIGKVMGRTESSVKSLYHRTLIALRDDLRERELI